MTMVETVEAKPLQQIIDAEIIRKAREFKAQMKELYEKVNENSSAKDIQEVITKIDQFLCINFRINIDDFAEGKMKNADGGKQREPLPDFARSYQ